MFSHTLCFPFLIYHSVHISATHLKVQKAYVQYIYNIFLLKIWSGQVVIHRRITVSEESNQWWAIK